MAQETLKHDGTHWLVTGDDAAPVRQPKLGLVPALENALAVIEFLNANQHPSATLAEICQSLGITKSHCHSILKTLVAYDWLRFDERSKSYELAAGMIASGSRLLNIPILEIIRREIASLTAEVRFPFIVTQPLGDLSYMLVEKFSDPLLMEVSLPIGHRYPKDACVQMRAFLAWKPPAFVDDWLSNWTPHQYTPSTPLTKDAVQAELSQSRARGYARSVGEFTEGLMAVALPIFSRAGDVLYIINCSAPTDSLVAFEDRVAHGLRDAVDRIHGATLATVPPQFKR